MMMKMALTPIIGYPKKELDSKIKKEEVMEKRWENVEAYNCPFCFKPLPPSRANKLLIKVIYAK